MPSLTGFDRLKALKEIASLRLQRQQKRGRTKRRHNKQRGAPETLSLRGAKRRGNLAESSNSHR